MTRSYRDITVRAAADGTLNSGGTVRKLVRSLIQHMEEAASTLISAHAKAGNDRPEEIAKNVQSQIEPIAQRYLDRGKQTLKSSKEAFDSIAQDVDKFYNSLNDRSIVALADYPKPTEQIIAALHPGNLPSDWDQVDRALQKARTQLSCARDVEDFQNVGLLCREVLISTAQVVYDPDRHPPLDGVIPSNTDAKRQLDSFFAAELAGSSNEEMRKHARSAVDLANTLVHKRTASLTLGSLCFVATSSVVSLITIVTVNRDQDAGKE